MTKRVSDKERVTYGGVNANNSAVSRYKAPRQGVPGLRKWAVSCRWRRPEGSMHGRAGTGMGGWDWEKKG